MNSLLIKQYKGPPVVTAYAWAIHDGKTGDLLWSKQEDEKREMASLTKIMTCFVACNLLKSLDLNPEKTIVPINRCAAWITGTHSGLREGDIISIMDLLYGMMLPSGNDCALTLAQCLGKLIMKNRKKESHPDLQSSVKEFVKEMNKTAIKYSLKNTKFHNPHGLSEKGNRSTVDDLGKLAISAMNNRLVETIVNTKIYTPNIIDQRGNKRILIWNNTNKLLNQGFFGVKTGNTPNAGPCLSLCVKEENDVIFITLLGCRTSEHRWQEAIKLANWSTGKLKMVKQEINSKSRTPTLKIRPKIIANYVNRYE